jgi:hypothetical protein
VYSVFQLDAYQLLNGAEALPNHQYKNGLCQKVLTALSVEEKPRLYEPQIHKLKLYRSRGQ